MSDEIPKAFIPGIMEYIKRSNDRFEHLEGRVRFVEDNSIAGLRDFFATSALAVLGNSDYFKSEAIKYDLEKIAKWSYKMADAMMAERDKK